MPPVNQNNAPTTNAGDDKPATDPTKQQNTGDDKTKQPANDAGDAKTTTDHVLDAVGRSAASKPVTHTLRATRVVEIDGVTFGASQVVGELRLPNGVDPRTIAAAVFHNHLRVDPAH